MILMTQILNWVGQGPGRHLAGAEVPLLGGKQQQQQQLAQALV
jgi:hypothetical protein